VNTKPVNAFCVNEKTFTINRFTKPAAAQTGLLSCKSFNHKNHSADNTVSHWRLPNKNPTFARRYCFQLQAYTHKQVKGEHRSGDLR
jgi:hypothetical protein